MIFLPQGAVDRYNCIYVKPQTGLANYRFNIMYDQCGSKPDLNGRFYENNIVIQYDQDLIEVWDEAKRLRCEWHNDYERGVTKPPTVHRARRRAVHGERHRCTVYVRVAEGLRRLRRPSRFPRGPPQPWPAHPRERPPPCRISTRRWLG